MFFYSESSVKIILKLARVGDPNQKIMTCPEIMQLLLSIHHVLMMTLGIYHPFMYLTVPITTLRYRNDDPHYIDKKTELEKLNHFSKVTTTGKWLGQAFELNLLNSTFYELKLNYNTFLQI